MTSRMSIRSLAAATLLSLCLGAFVAPTVSAAPPSNDDFSARTSIGSVPANVTQSIAEATMEGSEPASKCLQDHAGPEGSVWFQYTPTTTVTVRADTIGSDFAGGIAVYTGSSLGALSLVDCADEIDQDDLVQASSLTWVAHANVAYKIQVLTFEDPAGRTLELHLRKVTRPSNDDAAAATTIGKLPFSASFSNRSATHPSTQREASCDDIGADTWFRYTAPKNVTIQVDTLGSDYDTILAVYKGTSAASLSDILGACNDDTSRGYDTYQSLVTFKAAKGKTYFFQVGGWHSSSGNTELTLRAVTRPSNDDYATAEPIELDSLSPSVTTRKATWQPTEPVPPCATFPGATRWYSVVLGGTSSLNIQVGSSSDEHMFAAVYSGSSLGGLSSEACALEGVPDDTGALPAGTYHVQVGGSDATSGKIVFVVSENP